MFVMLSIKYINNICHAFNQINYSFGRLQCGSSQSPWLWIYGSPLCYWCVTLYCCLCLSQANDKTGVQQICSKLTKHWSLVVLLGSLLYREYGQSFTFSHKQVNSFPYIYEIEILLHFSSNGNMMIYCQGQFSGQLIFA